VQGEEVREVEGGGTESWEGDERNDEGLLELNNRACDVSIMMLESLTRSSSFFEACAARLSGEMGRRRGRKGSARREWAGHTGVVGRTSGVPRPSPTFRQQAASVWKEKTLLFLQLWFNRRLIPLSHLPLLRSTGAYDQQPTEYQKACQRSLSSSLPLLLLPTLPNPHQSTRRQQHGRTRKRPKSDHRPLSDLQKPEPPSTVSRADLFLLLPVLSPSLTPPLSSSPSHPAMSSTSEGPCAVCGVTTTQRCSPCAEHGFDLFLCCREHQKLLCFLPFSLSSTLSDRPPSTDLVRAQAVLC
jgi:hypothetical protein